MQLSFEDPRPQRLVWTAEDVSNAVAAYLAARNAVLNMPELLENILAHLPVHKLVVATRVSRAFQKMIMESPTLQKKLFLAVTKTEPEYCRLFKDEPQLETSIDQWSFPTGYLFMDKPEYSEDESLSQLLRLQVVRAGPMLHFFESEDDPDETRRLPKRMLRLRNPPHSLSHSSDYAHLREGAFQAGPWLQTYLTMPPCETACLKLFWRGRKANGDSADVWIRRTVRRVGGIKCSVINEMPSLLGKVGGGIDYAGSNEFRRLETQESSARAQLDMLEADGFKMSLHHVGQIEFPGTVMANDFEVIAMERDLCLIKHEAEEYYEVQKRLCEEMENEEQEEAREQRENEDPPDEDEDDDSSDENEDGDEEDDDDPSEGEEEESSKTQEQAESAESETDDAEDSSEVDEEASSQLGEEAVRRKEK